MKQMDKLMISDFIILQCNKSIVKNYRFNAILGEQSVLVSMRLSKLELINSLECCRRDVDMALSFCPYVRLEIDLRNG